MRARAMKGWLWGLLLMGVGLLATAGLVYGKAGTGSPPPAPGVAAQVHIPPFLAPSSMPALGEELARGMYAALRDANIPVRLGKGDEGSALVGRLEELSQAQVRLHASYHGHSVQSVGDLEHLDDLVYAVFTQLRPRLQSAAAGDTRSGALVGPASASEPTPTAVPVPKEAGPDSPRLASTSHPARPSTSSRHPAEPRPPGPTPVPVDKEPVGASPPPSLPSPPVMTSEPGPEPPARPPSPAPGPSKNPSVLTPRPPLAPFTFDPRRPRVAVHVVGDPLVRIPAGYSGLGAVGQQSLISYLQQRLRIPAVASRLVGLTGGLVALDQSLRVGARHSLMVRLDSLALAASPTTGPLPGPMPMGSAYAGGTLSGRIHIVLLLDGKLLLDRSVMLPPTLVLPSDTPAQAYSRGLAAAMDAVAGDLAGRLSESSSSPIGSAVGPPRSL